MKTVTPDTPKRLSETRGEISRVDREQLACDDGNVILERLRAEVRRQVIEECASVVDVFPIHNYEHIPESHDLRSSIAEAIRGIRG